MAYMPERKIIICKRIGGDSVYHFREYFDKLFDSILEQVETIAKRAIDVICVAIVVYYILSHIG